MATKIVRGTGILLLVFLFIVYPVWVSFPKEKYSRELREATGRTKERFDAIQAKANSPETNGYLAPTLLTGWIIKPDYEESKALDGPIRQWNEKYSSPGTGEDIDHRGLANDPDYLQKREAFAKLLPEIKKSLRADVFVVPQEGDYSFYDYVPNYIAVRRIALAMVGYTEALVAQGKTEEALDCVGPIFRLGYNLEQNPTLISAMIGVAIQAIGFQGLVEQIDLQAQASPQAWQRLAQDLARAIPDENLIVQSMASEVWVMENSVAQWRKGRRSADYDDELFDWALYNLPGILARDHRIYRNNMGKIFEALERDGDYRTIVNNLQKAGMVDYLFGRTGPMTTLGIPNFTRAGAQCRIIRAKVLGAAATIGAVAYRAKHGELPQNLDQLKDIGVELPQAENLKYTLKGNHAEILVQVATDDLEEIQVREYDSQKSKWFEWLEYGALFKI